MRSEGSLWWGVYEVEVCAGEWELGQRLNQWYGYELTRKGEAIPISR